MFTPENQNSSLSRLSTQVHFSYWSHMMLNILLSVFRKCLSAPKEKGKARQAPQRSRTTYTIHTKRAEQSTPKTLKKQNKAHWTAKKSRTKYTTHTERKKKLIYIYKVSNMLILINLNENQLIKCAEAQFQLSYSSTWPYNTHVPCRPSLLHRAPNPLAWHQRSSSDFETTLMIWKCNMPSWEVRSYTSKNVADLFRSSTSSTSSTTS